VAQLGEQKMPIRRLPIVRLLLGASFAVTPSMAVAASPPATHDPAHQGQSGVEGYGNGSFHGTFPIPGVIAGFKSALTRPA